MGNLIESKIIERQSVEYNWGKIVVLCDTDFYSIKEYTVSSSCSFLWEKTFLNSFFIVTSGVAEIALKSKKIKLFKSEKLEVKEEKINISNCGVIPLILIETILK